MSGVSRTHLIRIHLATGASALDRPSCWAAPTLRLALQPGQYACCLHDLCQVDEVPTPHREYPFFVEAAWQMPYAWAGDALEQGKSSTAKGSRVQGVLLPGGYSVQLVRH